MDVQMSLRRLIEIQLEQNGLAKRIAWAEAHSQIIALMQFLPVPDAQSNPDIALTAKQNLDGLMVKFEANQGKLRQLFLEVAAAPSGL